MKIYVEKESIFIPFGGIISLVLIQLVRLTEPNRVGIRFFDRLIIDEIAVIFKRNLLEL